MSKSFSIELPSNMTAGGGDQSSGPPLDLKALIGVVYRRFWMILAGFITTFGIIAYVTFTQTPIYKAQSVVQLNTQEKNVIDLGAIFSGLGGNTAVVDTEVLVMSSKTLLTRVAIKQKLVEDPEFNGSLRPKKTGMMSSMKGMIRAITGAKPPKDAMAGLTQEQKEAAALEGAVEALASKVDVKRVGTTYLITVTVASESPETAARLADEIAQQYRVQQLEEKYEATRKATEWLSERVSGLREEVEEKERRVESYRAESGLLAAQGATLTEQQIAYLTTQKATLQVEVDRARARADSMRRQMASGAGADGISEVLGSQVISDLKNQRAIINRRVAELETKLGPQHPELISARNEAADIDRQINAEVGRIAGNIENELKVAQSQLGSIQGEINRSTNQLQGNNQALVRLRELERDAETSRVLLEEFLSRSKQTREQDALISADANILSSATVPDSPDSPKKLLNLIIGCILGGIIGGGLALFAEMFDMKISSSEDVERKLGANPIGSVPLIRTASFLGLSQTNPADFLVENPLSAYAESIRYLRASIAFSDLDSETKTVAICSSLPDEGKTSLTLALGRMSAMSGSRTLVIDGDFRRRQLTETAGLKPDIGFVEHLFGAGQLSDAIVKDRKTMLDILPLSQNGHTPHDVFGTRAFDDLLARLRSMYDLILIDTGPLLLMAEARVVAGKVDKTILVVRWRHSARSAARHSLTLLRNFKADVLGVTLNMVDLNRRRHHKDPGATYKAYRKYYQMDEKPSIFGWGGDKRKNKPNPKQMKGSVAVQVPPSKATGRNDPAERISAE
ncbi:Wzz/FepE/Etk N-terminal domain-containing protein [Hyphomonas sp.]|uniref:GumC family protein n=1 Tax=Hyphomonas sp. TaxID=87 RepID=UPI0025C6B409|nr:Wzz/FepE/Etk N-terminal domain-containing protein [Hyphomonas sp.]MBI1400338.1 AAA family ATPase [Hyphomonas sp.]